MMELLWYAGLVYASLWGFGESILPMPAPMQAENGDRIEDRRNANDMRTAILPAIPAGVCASCDDPPGREEILRVMSKATRGVPYTYEELRDDFEFKVEKLIDHVDPPRFFPLIGPAQLHHCHWKCTVSFTETIESGYPFPFRAKSRRTEVVYIDKDRLHLCATNDTNAVNASTVSQQGRQSTTVDEVIKMSENGVGMKIIARQMEQTGATFDLSSEDIIRLRRAGVNNRLIGMMQERVARVETQGLKGEPVRGERPVVVRPVSSNTQGRPGVIDVDAPPAKLGEADRRLQQAFGAGCEELRRPYRLWYPEKGIALAAGQFDIDDKGRVRLAPFSVVVYSKGKVQPEFCTIRSEVAYLTFDQKVSVITDLANGKIIAVELQGLMINDRRVTDQSDGLGILIRTEGVIQVDTPAPPPLPAAVDR